MGKRQIKKTIIRYEEPTSQPSKANQEAEKAERSRSRDKKEAEDSHKANPVKIEEANVSSRRARLQAMRKAREQEQMNQQDQKEVNQPVEVVVKMNDRGAQSNSMQAENILAEEEVAVKKEVPQIKKQRKLSSQGQEEEEQEEQQGVRVVRKPVFIARQYRQPNKNDEQELKQQQRKKKNARYTTKMLLQQQKYSDSEQQNQQTDSQNQNNINFNGINDDDTIDEQLQFERWKTRELTRIRKAWQERRKHEREKVQIQRRRQMTNQAILIENKALGSDATENQTETKYAYMQKYYHRGAFYQDSQDEVFKRDYNLPTPMEMQDKTLLPKLLQKRVGNFGKKGQSKYTHLTAEDTTDTNPLTRADQSLLDYWKKRTAGYKGASGKNI